MVLYSQPMVDGRRAFMLRQQQSVNTSRPEVTRISVTEITPIYTVSFSLLMKQDEDMEEMKELDDIRNTHKRSIARRAAKLAEAQAAAKAGTNGSKCSATPVITQNVNLSITKNQF
jgi:hypothetical protein